MHGRPLWRPGVEAPRPPLRRSSHRACDRRDCWSRWSTATGPSVACWAPRRHSSSWRRRAATARRSPWASGWRPIQAHRVAAGRPVRRRSAALPALPGRGAGRRDGLRSSPDGAARPRAVSAPWPSSLPALAAAIARCATVRSRHRRRPFDLQSGLLGPRRESSSTPCRRGPRSASPAATSRRCRWRGSAHKGGSARSERRTWHSTLARLRSSSRSTASPRTRPRSPTWSRVTEGWAAGLCLAVLASSGDVAGRLAGRHPGPPGRHRAVPRERGFGAHTGRGPSLPARHVDPRSPLARAVPCGDRRPGCRRATPIHCPQQPVPERARRRRHLVSLPPPLRRLPAGGARPRGRGAGRRPPRAGGRLVRGQRRARGCCGALARRRRRRSRGLDRMPCAPGALAERRPRDASPLAGDVHG